MQRLGGIENDGGDTLDRLDRAGIVQVLAAYYRGLGWWVEFQQDGDFDLCLKRLHHVMLVHCGFWQGGRITSAALQAMPAAMARSGAESVLLVHGGRNDAIGIEIADDRIRPIDPGMLRGMVGVLPQRPASDDPFVEDEVSAAAARADAGRSDGRWKLVLIGLIVALMAWLAAGALADVGIAPFDR